MRFVTSHYKKNSRGESLDRVIVVRHITYLEKNQWNSWVVHPLGINVSAAEAEEIIEAIQVEK